MRLYEGGVQARGLNYFQLIEGSEINAIAELANWSVDSGKILNLKKPNKGLKLGY